MEPTSNFGGQWARGMFALPPLAPSAFQAQGIAENREENDHGAGFQQEEEGCCLAVDEMNVCGEVIANPLPRTLAGALWQRCQFHFQQNAQAYVTTTRYKSIAAAHIRSIFNAGSRRVANIMITNVLKTFRADGQDKLADWLENNIEECLAVIDCQPEVQKRLRTSTIMESINRQLKRRTNVISIFPSEASLLRIVTAKAMDLSDECEGITGKAYISPEKLHQTTEMLKAASSQPKKNAS